MIRFSHIAVQDISKAIASVLTGSADERIPAVNTAQNVKHFGQLTTGSATLRRVQRLSAVSTAPTRPRWLMAVQQNVRRRAIAIGQSLLSKSIDVWPWLICRS